MNRFNTLAAVRTRRGVTLIEVCIGLAVAAVMAGAALPSFDAVHKRRVMDGTSAEIANDVSFARSEAVARQLGVRVSVQDTPEGGTCVIVHTGGAHDCTCSTTTGTQCTADAVLLKTTLLSSATGVRVTSNVASMRFDQTNGTVSPAGTIRVTTPSGQAIHHVVNITGRVRTCAPGGSVPGVKAC